MTRDLQLFFGALLAVAAGSTAEGAGSSMLVPGWVGFSECESGSVTQSVAGAALVAGLNDGSGVGLKGGSGARRAREGASELRIGSPSDRRGRAASPGETPPALSAWGLFKSPRTARARGQNRLG